MKEIPQTKLFLLKNMNKAPLLKHTIEESKRDMKKRTHP